MKKFAADKFKILLEGSANRVEYQLNSIRRKYDLREDDQKIKFVHEAAEMICTLGSAVQREVYGGRVAEAAGISADAMKMEIGKAYKRRIDREKKKQEKIDLAPAQAMKPKARSIRYDNMKSAMAEEAVIAMVLKDPSLLDKTAELKKEMFSVDVLGNVYGQLYQRHFQGLEVSLGVLSGLEGEEMSHVAMILHKQSGPVSEDALRDCIRTIRSEYQKKQVSSADDLLALRERMKERKGFNK